MNNIEKLQNIFKELRKDYEEGHSSAYELQWEDIQAIENLIQENKELKEKDKKWEELYDEDQEYITQLNNKIFQLETDNKKLDKENQGLFEAYNFNDTNLFAKTLKEYRKEILNSVPKSKVKEHLQELDEMKVDGKVFTTAVNFAKQILQELLEEGDDK